VFVSKKLLDLSLFDTVVLPLDRNLGPDLQNILQQSYILQ